MENGSADSAYYNFIDRFDMLGVGKDVPLATGNLSEGLLMLVDGKFMTLRVPYPMGYYAKRLDGRIDDPKAGWKGKGIYTPISTRAHSTWKAAKGVVRNNSIQCSCSHLFQSILVVQSAEHCLASKNVSRRKAMRMTAHRRRRIHKGCGIGL